MKFYLLSLLAVITILLIGCQSTSTFSSENAVDTIYFIGKPYHDPEAALLYSVKTDGSDLKRVADLEGWRGRVSPDGTKLLWTPDDHRISIYDFKTQTINVILDEEAYNWDSCWSPDGTKIAFASRRTGKFDIWVMDADGSNLRNITNTSDVGEWDPRWGKNNRIYFGKDMIADVGWERVPDFFNDPIQMCSIDPDGNNFIQHTNGEGWNANHSLSQDGNYILNGDETGMYISDMNGEIIEYIYLMEEDQFYGFRGHVLSSDNKSIIMSAMIDEEDERLHLYKYDIKERSYSRITMQDEMEEWFPDY